MRYVLKINSIWEFGQRIDSEGNPHQEDSIFPAYGQQKDSDRLFILCDGMGGHEAGEVASATVCTAMSKSIFKSTPDAEGDFSDDKLQKAIEDAFNALDALPLEGSSTEKKMGTTMTFLKFHSKGCTIAHMGDSRVYHIRPGKGREDTRILFKTEDHSLVNDLIKVGELTPEEAKHSRQKNIITRAMQPAMERRPKADIYHTSDIKKGDYFYMCSDGMLEQMEDENLQFNFSEATGSEENKVNILKQATSQNLDNHSAIIIHVLDVIDPLPVDEAPTIIANKPEPIMAEVDEDTKSQPLEDSKLSKFNNRTKKETKSLSGAQKLTIQLITLLLVACCALFITILSAFSSYNIEFDSSETDAAVWVNHANQGRSEAGIEEVEGEVPCHISCKITDKLTDGCLLYGWEEERFAIVNVTNGILHAMPDQALKQLLVQKEEAVKGKALDHYKKDGYIHLILLSTIILCLWNARKWIRKKFKDS